MTIRRSLEVHQEFQEIQSGGGRWRGIGSVLGSHAKTVVSELSREVKRITTAGGFPNAYTAIIRVASVKRNLLLVELEGSFPNLS